MFVVQINLKRPKGSCKYIMLALGIQFIYLRHLSNSMYHHHIPPRKIIHDNILNILIFNILINSQIHVLCSNSSSFNFTPNCQVSCKIYNMYTEPNMKFNLAAMKKHHKICQNFLWVFLFL